MVMNLQMLEYGTVKEQWLMVDMYIYEFMYVKALGQFAYNKATVDGG